MRKIFLLGLGLSGLGVYWYYKRQVDLLYKMKYSIADVKILEKTSDNMKVQIILNVVNNSEIDFTLTGWNFEMLINNELVSLISDNGKKVFVKANGGQTQLSFNASFSPKDYGLIDLLASVIDTGKGTLITLKGNVSVYSGFIVSTKSPVDITWRLEDFL